MCSLAKHWIVIASSDGLVVAIVYEGADDESGRRVALKMLSHRLVYDKPSLAWFQREADIIERFEHENIVKMSGRFHAFHSYFIVMEFCDGITLERLVRLNGPMNPDDFRKTFGQLAAALLYAHERDVIHRDLKPVNMMVNFDGMLKLMDFGLAMPLHTVPDALELDRQVVGTPRYMAPEQLMGRELTEAADYFSLGCTAYKLLTGDSLFVESDVIKLREIHASWNAPDFASRHPTFSPEICELLTGCLQRKPEARVCDLAKYALWAKPLDVTRLL
jgi:serine/threonine protein kinase